MTDRTRAEARAPSPGLARTSRRQAPVPALG